jgi:ABC-2 type transport system ATP-binding protein
MTKHKSEVENEIRISHLYKTYKGAKKETLSGIDLTIQRGEFIGILGPNGAGKTTTINCITGVTSQTSGTVTLFGRDTIKDYREARKLVGVSPQEFNVDIFETADSILDFQAGYFGITGERMKARREELIKQFELEPHRGKRFQFLSGGLKRRVVLAKALMHNPEILILDEPTAGVDVETRQALWKYLQALHKAGKTIILTSHYLEEVQLLCTRVAMINGGKIVLDGAMSDITKEKSLEAIYLEQVESNGNEQ